MLLNVFFLNELGCLLCCQSIWRLSHDSSKRRKIWHDESDEHKRFKGNYDTWRRKAVGSYSLTGIWKQRSMTSHWAFIYLQGKCQCSGFESLAVLRWCKQTKVTGSAIRSIDKHFFQLSYISAWYQEMQIMFRLVSTHQWGFLKSLFLKKINK